MTRSLKSILLAFEEDAKTVSNRIRPSMRLVLVEPDELLAVCTAARKGLEVEKSPMLRRTQHGPILRCPVCYSLWKLDGSQVGADIPQPTPTEGDLVERLRNFVRQSTQLWPELQDAIIEAADTITRLQGEVDQWEKHWAEIVVKASALKDERDVLRKRVEELEGLLQLAAITAAITKDKLDG